MAMIFLSQLKPVITAVLYGFILSGHREKRSYANLKTNEICNSLWETYFWIDLSLAYANLDTRMNTSQIRAKKPFLSVIFKSKQFSRYQRGPNYNYSSKIIRQSPCQRKANLYIMMWSESNVKEHTNVIWLTLQVVVTLGPWKVMSSMQRKVTTACRLDRVPSSQPLGKLPGEPQLISLHWGLKSPRYIHYTCHSFTCHCSIPFDASKKVFLQIQLTVISWVTLVTTVV